MNWFKNFPVFQSTFYVKSFTYVNIIMKFSHKHSCQSKVFAVNFAFPQHIIATNAIHVQNFLPSTKQAHIHLGGKLTGNCMSMIVESLLTRENKMNVLGDYVLFQKGVLNMIYTVKFCMPQGQKNSLFFSFDTDDPGKKK